MNYIPKDERSTILFLCDDIRTTSGIATMAREIVINTANHFNWVTVGAAINHPEQGKRLDLSADTNKHANISDASIVIYPFNGYGTPEFIRYLMRSERPDAILFFTDPRYYTWLFDMEHEIRKEVPLLYYQIWDNAPAPLYNREYYRSCDALLAISKQTENLNKIVLGEYLENRFIKNIPHGINSKYFFPMNEIDEKLLEFKKDLFKGKQYDYVLFFNSRNIRRKQIPDTLLAYKFFLDKLTLEQRKKCAFVLHTQAIDENGTNLHAVIDLLFGDDQTVNIIFSEHRIGVESMNLLYNSVDVGILLSSNEGWGLSITECLMTGKMVIGNVTGGIQDQLGFVDENGDPIVFTEKFTTNHNGKYKNCGEWAIPVFPSNISIQGSVPTPYIEDDRCNSKEVADAIYQTYIIGKEERERRGMIGYNWAKNRYEAHHMADGIGESIDVVLDNWTPRQKYDLIKITKKPKKHLKYPISL